MRVLFIKLSSLGDLLHALPTAQLLQQGLKQRFGGAELDWVTQPEYTDLVSRFDCVSSVIPFPRHNFLSGYRAYRRQVRARDYDLVVDVHGMLKSGLAARSAKSSRRIGPSFAREGNHLFQTELAGPKNRQRHAIDECLDVLRHLDLPDEPVTFPVNWVPFIGKLGERPVAIAPCSRWTAKNWPLDRFAALAQALAQDPTIHLHLVGGPADETAANTLLAALAPDRATSHCGKTSIPELGGLLARMELLITNDSGPMHMAVAAGTRTLALFGPTDPHRTGPYGEAHQVLAAPRDGSSYKVDDQRIISQLQVDEVVEAARSILG